MWEELLITVLLEASGFQLEKSFEDTLNEYFLEDPEDEFLLELEFISADLKKPVPNWYRNALAILRSITVRTFRRLCVKNWKKSMIRFPWRSLCRGLTGYGRSYQAVQTLHS